MSLYIVFTAFFEDGEGKPNGGGDIYLVRGAGTPEMAVKMAEPYTKTCLGDPETGDGQWQELAHYAEVWDESFEHWNDWPEIHEAFANSDRLVMCLQDETREPNGREFWQPCWTPSFLRSLGKSTSNIYQPMDDIIFSTEREAWTWLERRGEDWVEGGGWQAIQKYKCTVLRRFVHRG